MYNGGLPFVKGDKQAVLGLTITEKALRDSGLSSMGFYEYWRDNTKFGQMRLKNLGLGGNKSNQ